MTEDQRMLTGSSLSTRHSILTILKAWAG